MDYKGYNISALKTFPMFEIKARGQGFVPGALDGYFLTKVDAIRQIDVYLGSLLKGKRKNEQTKDGSTG